MADTETPWLKSIYSQIRKNNSEIEKISGLYQAYETLQDQLAKLKSDQESRNTELSVLRRENADLLSKLSSGTTSKEAEEKIHSLEQKVFSLQEELNKIYKERKTRDDEYIQLQKDSLSKDKLLAEKESQIIELTERQQLLQTANTNLEAALTELEKSNTMIKDEHTAVQAAYVSLEARFRQLEGDNADLIQRYMDIKSRDADILNAEAEKFAAQRRQRLKSELQDAALEPATVSLELEDTQIPDARYSAVVTVPSRAQHKFDAHDGEVSSVRWSPSGRFFSTGGSDRKIKIWTVENGHCENHEMECPNC